MAVKAAPAFAIVFARTQCNITDDGASDEVKREAESAAPATVMSDPISKCHWETGKAEREGLNARRPAVTEDECALRNLGRRAPEG